MDNFDASKVINQQPWLERAIQAVAPSWGLKRLEARVQRELYSYNASVTNRIYACLLYTSPSPRDYAASRMPSSA